MTTLANEQGAQVRELLKPLLGQLVWNVRRGHGSFLTMEFGKPHLDVREPIVPRHSKSARVRRHLQRRQAFVTGDWHLWIQGEWKICTIGGSLDSNRCSGSRSDERLGDLDGQKLLSIDDGSAPHSLLFKFDLGGTLEVWPSPGIEDDQWSLHGWNGEIVACDNNGGLVFEKSARLRDSVADGLR